jgi:hypothetical protein
MALVKRHSGVKRSRHKRKARIGFPPGILDARFFPNLIRFAWFD